MTNPISLLTFRISQQRLALPIDKVREVIRNVPVMPAPAWTGLLHGIIHIRGMVIPVMDLRLVLGSEPSIDTSKTRIVIVEMLERSAGFIVDEVDDIIPLKQEQLIPLSSLSWEKKTAVLVGIAQIEEQIYLVLDMDYLIREEERKVFQELCLKLQQNPMEITKKVEKEKL
ncbi:MAG: purine-binding chemotaxis protein CheW [Candidatus Brocadiae bacterium]|nr:purine-binding chemotaxis protein CheW [Candidatus Brocadiia bacterium]